MKELPSAKRFHRCVTGHRASMQHCICLHARVSDIHPVDDNLQPCADVLCATVLGDNESHRTDRHASRLGRINKAHVIARALLRPVRWAELATLLQPNASNCYLAGMPVENGCNLPSPESCTSRMSIMPSGVYLPVICVLMQATCCQHSGTRQREPYRRVPPTR